MAMFGPSLEEEDERKLYRNWSLLKNELDVDKIVDQLVERQVFSDDLRKDIRNVQPNTKVNRAEKLLRTIMRVGQFAYEDFCELIRNDSNRYQEIIQALKLDERPLSTLDEAISHKVRPLSSVSSTGSPMSRCSSNDGETGERRLRRNGTQIVSSVFEISRSVGQNRRENACIVAQETTSQMAMAAAASFKPSGNGNELAVNVEMLEKELVKMAPSIAQLFEKISRTMSVDIPIEQEEYTRVKNENESLRKANRSLVEKLNSFQQKIISLQLENKRLRDSGEGTKETMEKLTKRAVELDSIKIRLEGQKSDLEEKEVDLDHQLEKMKQIEIDNEKQKVLLMNLQVKHDDEMAYRLDQEDQIADLKAQKEKQQDKIEMLELIQREEDESLRRLEDRLNSLEQFGSPRYPQQTYQKASTRSKRNTRIVSPPGSTPWMGGLLSRSHHANIKPTQPQLQTQPPQSFFGRP